jgi:predicted alpha/beta hydrolase family esterase
MIYEELLCLQQKPKRVAFVGHSQGGAASSVACTDRVVEALNVTGLMLIGSESSRSGRDGQSSVPKPKKVLRVIHAGALLVCARFVFHFVVAVEDEVVAFAELERLCEAWSVPMIACQSAVRGKDVSKQNIDFL